MLKQSITNILIIGLDCNALFYSARKAGYQSFIVDFFGDQDAKKPSSKYLSIINQKKNSTCGRFEEIFHPYKFFDLAKKISKNNSIDGILISSGLDDSPKILNKLSQIAPIIGNSIETIKTVRNKKEFISKLEDINVTFPDTKIIENKEELNRSSIGIRYPIVLKPLDGFGGMRIRLANDWGELKKYLNESCYNSGFMLQQYIDGKNISASIMSTTHGSVVLTLNEQLIGTPLFKNRKSFKYCGNIVPTILNGKEGDRCYRAAEKIASSFGLIGSNGVDFVIDKNGIPYVMEVNPRFQGSLECVELKLGKGLVKMHISASMENILPRIAKFNVGFFIRLILYAPYRSIIPNLSIYNYVRDIPLQGSIVEEGEPLCSVITWGKSRHSTVKKAQEKAEEIFKLLRSV